MRLRALIVKESVLGVHPYALRLEANQVKIRTCFYWSFPSPRRPNGVGDFVYGVDCLKTPNIELGSR